MTNALTLAPCDENLPAVISLIRRTLQAAGCPAAEVMRLELAAEEIFINIARHAYGDCTGAATVHVETTNAPRQAVVRFVDHGVPFNPLRESDPDVTVPEEEREIGGLGVFLAQKAVDGIAYAHEDGKNIVTLYKRF